MPPADQKLSGNFFGLSLAELQRRPFLFLGAAIEWIICRDQASSSTVVAENWDAAERELFDFLDAGTVDVQGYRAPDHPRVPKSLPQGIWARMNKGARDDPKFSPIDDSEEREDGGSVCVGTRRWDGVRLPTSAVLQRWPPCTPNTVPTDDPPPADYSEDTITAWFVARVKAWKEDPLKTPRLSRDKLWRVARAKDGPLPGLKSTQYRPVFEDNAPPQWKERGAQRKKE